MAKPSKQRPWVLQMYNEQTQKWYPTDAFKTKDLAEAHRLIAVRNAPTTAWSVRKIGNAALKDETAA